MWRKLEWTVVVLGIAWLIDNHNDDDDDDGRFL